MFYCYLYVFCLEPMDAVLDGEDESVSGCGGGDLVAFGARGVRRGGRGVRGRPVRHVGACVRGIDFNLLLLYMIYYCKVT